MFATIICLLVIVHGVSHCVVLGRGRGLFGAPPTRLGIINGLVTDIMLLVLAQPLVTEPWGPPAWTAALVVLAVAVVMAGWAWPRLAPRPQRGRIGAWTNLALAVLLLIPLLFAVR